MNIERLIKNMTDQVKELQIKLGYVRETVRLYYPLSSLNALLETDFSDDKAGREALQRALEEALRKSALESDCSSSQSEMEQEQKQEQVPANCNRNGMWRRELAISVHGGRFEFNIPPEGAEYIHQNEETSAFLQELVTLFQENHHCSLEEICEVFARTAARSVDLAAGKAQKGNGYLCEKMPEGVDFDYVIYFEDLSIDEYYYCIKMEMGHTIYHRFMREDYERLQYSE